MTRAQQPIVWTALVALVYGWSGGNPLRADDADQLGAWTRVTEHADFLPRDTAEDLVFDGRMWLSDGYFGLDPPLEGYKDLWSSTDGLKWTLVNARTPYSPYSELVSFNGKMWAIKESIWNSSDGRTWTEVLHATPFGRRTYGEVVVFNDRLWQLGSGGDVWQSSDGVLWTYVKPRAGFGSRFGAAVVAFNGRLWLMGGWTETPNTPPEAAYPLLTSFNDVWSSEDGDTWTRVTEHAPWQPRMWFPARVYGNRIVIAGGFDNTGRRNLNDVWFTEDGRNWQPLVSSTAFSPRHEPACYVFAGSLWVVAGNAFPLTNDVWRWTPWPQAARDNSPMQTIIPGKPSRH